MNCLLEVFSDLSERPDYNLPNFPLYARKGTLQQFDRYCVTCHWHPDLEFVLVLDGSIDYFVNGQLVTIEKNNGIFVNSKRMHYGFSNNHTNCFFLVIGVHPILLGEATHAGKSFLEEKFGSCTDDFLLLNSNVAWQQNILLSLSNIYDKLNGNQENLLYLLSQTVSLCANIAKHINWHPKNNEDEQSLMTIRKMTAYIHQCYELKITLDDIANAGAVCRGKGCEMLRETNGSICEIALSCGFQSSSYFSYVFRKELGLVPQDFRKQTV